ncbi:MAG: nucleoside transporter C-terminal domain-containing protein, partial [Aestuariivirgaceae bacterium]
LIVMVALVELANLILAALSTPFGVELKAERILGWLAAPLAFVIGVPWGEAAAAGELIGIKTILNELLAYLKLAATPAEVISERSRLILTYALCGFANLGSLGIMTGGLVAMCPERYDDIVRLGPKTIISGTLATLLTGAVIGLISW